MVLDPPCTLVCFSQGYDCDDSGPPGPTVAGILPSGFIQRHFFQALHIHVNLSDDVCFNSKFTCYKLRFA